MGAEGKASTRETAGTLAAVAGSKLPASRQKTGKNTDRKADARIVGTDKLQILQNRAGRQIPKTAMPIE